MNRQTLREEYPGFLFIDEMESKQITDYLRRRKIEGLEHIHVESRQPLGDGNMNITRLLKTNFGALVLKQSVPWVAKYPSIAAPWDRSIREASFYNAVEPVKPLSDQMPQLLDVDLSNRTLLFRFEPQTQDYSDIYADPALLTSVHAEAAARWLAKLHTSHFDPDKVPRITNRDMRALNHEHIFDIPFRPDNGIDLDAITPGLQNSAQKLIQDGKLAQKARELGETYYLADGEVLLHGDYFPGSWLRRNQEILVLDPEFAFMGHAAFDVSVALAHFDMAQVEESIKHSFLDTYESISAVDTTIMEALRGIEVLRRVIGVAQLPLTANLETKNAWLDEARDRVLAL